MLASADVVALPPEIETELDRLQGRTSLADAQVLRVGDAADNADPGSLDTALL